MRIASIGYGNMGAKYARMIYDNLIPDMTLTCVCVHHAETIEKVREDLGNDVVCTVGKDDLFSHSDLFDAVLIAVPHPSHFQYFKTAAEKGKHVLCEKPASITAKEAEEMESLAEEKHITYGLIFQHRFFARNQYIKDLLETGRLGKIERADLSMSMFRTLMHTFEANEMLHRRLIEQYQAVEQELAEHAGEDPMQQNPNVTKRIKELLNKRDALADDIRNFEDALTFKIALMVMNYLKYLDQKDY